MQYVPALGLTFEEMRENARKSDLWKRGDMRLVWVNEGDLIRSQCAHDWHQHTFGQERCSKCGETRY